MSRGSGLLKRSSRRVILFHEKMNRIDEDIREYDIFLTPKFYVVRREKLPVKFTFQARKLAPSILDELTENGEDVIYVVYKDGEEWIFIAYNPASIYEHAVRIGLDPDSARSIFFAEQIRDRLQQPLCIGEDSALAVIEEYVTLIPRSFTGEEGCKKSDSSILKASKSYASAVKSSTLSPAQSYIIAGALSLMAILIFAEGVRYSNAAEKETDKIRIAADGDPVLISKLSRDNILQKYRGIDRRERDIRETLKKIGTLLGSAVELISFKSDEKGYSTVLKTSNSTAMKILEKKVVQKGFNYKKRGNELTISGRWK